MNPVPCIYVHNRDQQLTVHDGKLADVATTLLWMMGLPAPAEMDGEVLIHQL